jgi:hypothetical protein
MRLAIAYHKGTGWEGMGREGSGGGGWGGMVLDIGGQERGRGALLVFVPLRRLWPKYSLKLAITCR